MSLMLVAGSMLLLLTCVHHVVDVSGGQCATLTCVYHVVDVSGGQCATLTNLCPPCR